MTNSQGSGSFAPTGTNGPVSATGSSCNPSQALQACLASFTARLLCDPTTNAWKLLQQCPAGSVCTETAPDPSTGKKHTACLFPPGSNDGSSSSGATTDTGDAGAISNVDDGGGTSSSSGATSGGLTDSGSTSGGLTDSGSTSGGLTDSGSTSGGLTDSGSTSGAVADSGSTSGAIADSGSTSGAIADSGVDTTSPDAGTSADTGATVNDIKADSGPSSTDAGASGAFTVNPCWDSKCSKEVGICKADADCSALAKCVKDSKGVSSAAKCAQDANWSQAKYEAASNKYTDISTCGWAACADPTKGSCKGNCEKYFGDQAACNCDGQCVKYGDCCADHKALCPAQYSCKGKCGKSITSGTSGTIFTYCCACDANCKSGTGQAACCADYALQCP